jgi:hypothetical protein
LKDPAKATFEIFMDAAITIRSVRRKSDRGVPITSASDDAATEVTEIQFREIVGGKP